MIPPINPNKPKPGPVFKSNDKNEQPRQTIVVIPTEDKKIVIIKRDTNNNYTKLNYLA